MSIYVRPKVVTDVNPPQRSVWKGVAERLNLGYTPRRHVPLIALAKGLIAFLSFWMLIAGSATAPTNPTLAANNKEEERRALEAELEALERQIDKYQQQIASYRTQGKNLTKEIERLNTKIVKLTLQIQAVNLGIAKLDREIRDTQEKVVSTQAAIETNRAALADLIRNLYVSDRESLVEIFLERPTLSDFFSSVQSITVFQSNLRIATARIVDLQNQLKNEERQLALARADAAAVRAYQEDQRREADHTKREKQILITVTKMQESKYQELLKKSHEEKKKLLARIFELLGGGELTFGQAYEFAKYASAATGVRPALILAVLDRESALGQNVGRCNYKTAMSPQNQPIFLEITAELNINPDTVTVSCPNADGVYGGAMGPAQFIPSTWQLYRDQVRKITGNNPPSPWNNADAFVAAALYLKDAGAASNERIAAAKYYCGSRWNRYVCTNVYGRKVVEQAERFEADIVAITSQ